MIVASNKEVVRFNVTMNDALLMHNLDSLDHLYGNVENGLEVELAAALLEQIFKRLTEQIHDHNVIHLAILGLLVTNKMEVRDCGLTSQLVDQFGLPEKHDMLLVLDGLLNLGGKEVSSLLLLNFVEFTKCATSQLLDYLVALIENLLSFFHSEIGRAHV